jgi:hypothetical protein
LQIGRLVRDLFPIPRGNRPAVPSPQNSSYFNSSGNDAGQKDRPHHNESKLNQGELTVVPDAYGRYGVSMTSTFVGDDSVASLSAEQKRDMESFEEFSEFAVLPEM